MDTNSTTMQDLRMQELDLCRQIAGLGSTVEASSTPGIREFRMTRLRQLRNLHEELSERVRRLEFSPVPLTDAYLLESALREASLVVESTFRA